jgi:hypothetical protein
MMSEEADNPGDSVPLRQRLNRLSQLIHNKGQVCKQASQVAQTVVHRGGIQPIPK